MLQLEKTFKEITPTPLLRELRELRPRKGTQSQTLTEFGADRINIQAPRALSMGSCCRCCRGRCICFFQVNPITYSEIHILTKSPSTSPPRCCSGRSPRPSKQRTRLFHQSVIYSWGHSPSHQVSASHRTFLPTKRLLWQMLQCPLFAKLAITGLATLPFPDSGLASRSLNLYIT